MAKEIILHFPKLYRYDRIDEHCGVGIPFAKGEFTDKNILKVTQAGKERPVQLKVTSRYDDGSAKFVYLRFTADLPANKGCELLARVADESEQIAIGENALGEDTDTCLTRRSGSVITVDTGAVSFAVEDGSDRIFSELESGGQKYLGSQLSGPFLSDDRVKDYGMKLSDWRIMEAGPLVSVLRCMGNCTLPESGNFSGASLEKNSADPLPTFEVKLTAWAGKPWVEVSYRLIASVDEPMHVKSLIFQVKRKEDSPYDPELEVKGSIDRGDSVGEGSISTGVPDLTGPLYETTGTKYLDMIENKEGGFKVRTCVGSSNYKTNFTISDNKSVERVIDAKYIIGEANEHFTEVFYGTLFTDVTDEEGGVCATVFQAQQNYPKAVKADESGIYVMLVPGDVEEVVMQSGMSREQRFLLHFHDAKESMAELDNRSLIYQMPDRPWINPYIYADAGVMPDIFVKKENIRTDVERVLVSMCDTHSRSFGMLNFGDSPDLHYTEQGRGKGNLVWSNNEYDFPHACALLYARTGERRFLDYTIANASHWMDVDVCHYSRDELLIGGQWEHTQGHCVEGCMVCSHEWVEGLLDMYHFTGDERAYETALGIGENILRLLETPAYQVSGESNARETGWALRSLVALYAETGDKKWVSKGEWIVGHFKEWTDEYGGWLSPYTDNTAIRVGFMISVAVGSLMRYYRFFPSKELKDLIIFAVDDLLDNALMANGVFYYKELPSLNRLNTNTLLLEALAIAYELTGNEKYLEAGIVTFENAIANPPRGVGGKKVRNKDAVYEMGNTVKNFGQCFMPLSAFYKALSERKKA